MAHRRRVIGEVWGDAAGALMTFCIHRSWPTQRWFNGARPWRRSTENVDGPSVTIKSFLPFAHAFPSSEPSAHFGGYFQHFGAAWALVADILRRTPQQLDFPCIGPALQETIHPKT